MQQTLLTELPIRENIPTLQREKLMIEGPWIDPREEARVVPNGAPIEGAATLYEGSLGGARGFVESLAVKERAKVSVWTRGHVFTVPQFLAEIPGHEHDPLKPKAA